MSAEERIMQTFFPENRVAAPDHSEPVSNDPKYGSLRMWEIHELLAERGLDRKGAKYMLIKRLHESDARIANGKLEYGYTKPKKNDRKFTCFMKLPPEIRAMVFDFHLLSDKRFNHEVCCALPETTMSETSSRMLEDGSAAIKEKEEHEYVLKPIHRVKQYYQNEPNRLPMMLLRKHLCGHVYALLRVSRLFHREALARLNIMFSISFQIRINEIDGSDNWNPLCGDVLRVRRIAGTHDQNASESDPRKAIMTPFSISEQKRIIIYLKGPFEVFLRSLGSLADISMWPNTERAAWARNMTAFLENLVRCVLLPSKLLYLTVVMTDLHVYPDDLDEWIKQQVINPILKPLEVLRGLRQVQLINCSATMDYQTYLEQLLTSAKAKVQEIPEEPFLQQGGSLPEDDVPTPEAENSALSSEDPTPAGGGSSLFG
ncbi:MAG: hypothetical protein M1812_000544 [Candelaria pacifica]|nr:MAG: hypothetical protein M1812_000544 [Candelaria pacifica]